MYNHEKQKHVFFTLKQLFSRHGDKAVFGFGLSFPLENSSRRTCTLVTRNPDGGYPLDIRMEFYDFVLLLALIGNSY